MQKYCAYCEKPFEAGRETQKYCSRFCFKQSYIQNLKADEPPEFCCPSCGSIIKLDFNPKKDKEKWKEFTCLICGFKKSEEELTK